MGSIHRGIYHGNLCSGHGKSLPITVSDSIASKSANFCETAMRCIEKGWEKKRYGAEKTERDIKNHWPEKYCVEKG